MQNLQPSTTRISCLRGLIALSPIAAFLLIYLAVSVYIGDFYKMPLSLAFIVAAAWAMLTTRNCALHERIAIFSKGAANENVLYMIWIFILAGAFSSLAKGIGAVDATVELATNWLPSWFLVPGLFLVTCFISMSIGTSVGTIVALTPFACQLAEASGGSVAFYVSIVLSGSFFGDNLSFISDTTIAATRSQGVAMNEKFKTNLRIALPAALITLGIYAIQSSVAGSFVPPAMSHSWQLILPYLIVLVTAMIGGNVLIVLSLGIVSCMALAYFYHEHALMSMCSYMGEGISGMSDLIIVTLLASGLLGLISHNGGIDFIIQRLTSYVIRGSRGAQLCVSLLVGIVNICTANNTIAIITVGEIARSVGSRFGVDPSKTASLLDTSSCVVQCIIPYGAQCLLAASLSHLAPVAFFPYLYYTWALAAMIIISILIKRKK